MNVLSFRQVRQHIDSGKPFTATVVKYDRKRKTGGAIWEIEAQLAKEKPNKRPQTKREHLRGAIHNNYAHYTRNVRMLMDGLETSLIRKIHVPLIIKFNGCDVTP